jgi:hypothetical protein
MKRSHVSGVAHASQSAPDLNPGSVEVEPSSAIGLLLLIRDLARLLHRHRQRARRLLEQGAQLGALPLLVAVPQASGSVLKRIPRDLEGQAGRAQQRLRLVQSPLGRIPCVRHSPAPPWQEPVRNG